MKRIIQSTISIIAFGFIIFNCNLCLADQIETKDGSIVKGKIIDHTLGQGYKIRTSDGNIFYFEESKILTIKYGPNPGEPDQEAPVQVEPTKAPPGPVYTYKRSPALAWFLSFLFPGAGNFYTKDFIGGGIFAGIATTSLYMFISGITMYEDGECGDYDEEDDEYKLNDCDDAGIGIGLGFLAFMGVSIGSQITAPIKAKRLNWEPEESGHAEEIQSSFIPEPKPRMHLSINPDFVKNKKRINLSLQYDF